MCEYLNPLETYIRSLGVPETFSGQPWSDNCREWIYYDGVLDVAALQSRFSFPAIVQVHENTDPRSGTELGFFCTHCKDAIMGLHPQFSQSKLIT